MLKLLSFMAGLSPVLVLLMGLGGGGGLTFLYTKFIHDPQLIHEVQRAERDACTIRTQDAANKAEAAERARQQAVTADALRAYQEALDARERLASELQDQIEQGISDYDKLLVEQGRSCPLTDADIERLRQ